jgi:hypothetical protein
MPHFLKEGRIVALAPQKQKTELLNAVIGY